MVIQRMHLAGSPGSMQAQPDGRYILARVLLPLIKKRLNVTVECHLAPESAAITAIYGEMHGCKRATNTSQQFHVAQGYALYI